MYSLLNTAVRNSTFIHKRSIHKKQTTRPFLLLRDGCFFRQLSPRLDDR